MSKTSQVNESTSLWAKVEKQTELFEYENLKEFYSKIGEVTGKETIYPISDESYSNEGFVSIWVAIAHINRKFTDIAKEYGEKMFEHDEEIKKLNEKVEQLEDKVTKFAEHNKGLTETEVDVLVALEKDKAQKDIAEDLDVSEPYVSQVKSSLVDKGVYSDE